MAAVAAVAAPSKVLNVNDSEHSRYVISRMLDVAGFDVSEAANGAVALELCRDPRRQPDVLVLDIKMPGLDGFEICRRLKADPVTSPIKVLHTSAAHVGVDSKIQGLESGADAYLFQPFEEAELTATVDSLLRLRATERELTDKAERLAETDRRKDEFLAMLAHELRNPLAALTSALAVLGGYPPRDDQEKKHRAISHRQTTQLTLLVNDLLDVSRVTRGTINLRGERVDLVELLRRVVASQSELGPGGDGPPVFTLDLPDQPVVVQGDPGRLEQCFVNLVDNAIKYTGSDARVKVSVASEAAGDGAAVVTVSDNGVGIARELLPGVFDLFSQAHVSLARESGGLGIGLTLVQRLIELHGGTISVDSPGRGEGTTVTVRLPLDDGDPGAPRHDADDDSDTPLPREEDRTMIPTRRHLLVVEDNKDVREALKELGEIWGHRVSVAGDGQQGVEVALKEAPDLALVDIGLPGIDGFEVARRIRSDRRGDSIHLVALTGYGSREHRQQAEEAGFDGFLIKPGEPATLRAMLDGPLRGDDE
jgi:signal transduction histidine kinase